MSCEIQPASLNRLTDQQHSYHQSVSEYKHLKVIFSGIKGITLCDFSWAPKSVLPLFSELCVFASVVDAPPVSEGEDARLVAVGDRQTIFSRRCLDVKRLRLNMIWQDHKGRLRRRKKTWKSMVFCQTPLWTLPGFFLKTNWPIFFRNYPPIVWNFFTLPYKVPKSSQKFKKRFKEVSKKFKKSSK